MNTIWYEGKKRIISEVEHDHIHLDDGTVIRNTEIIKTPLGNISKYSQKKEIKKINKIGDKLLKKIEKLINTEWH